MTTIYLIRHAEAEGNLYRRIHGWYDALVTENGWKQIQALETRFAGVHVDAVWSSDLYRTCATARAVYVPKGLELHTDPDLREINMGRWEDRTWGEVRQTEGERLLQFNHSDPAWVAPGGESLGDVGASGASPENTPARPWLCSATALLSASSWPMSRGSRRKSGTPCHMRTTPP